MLRGVSLSVFGAADMSGGCRWQLSCLFSTLSTCSFRLVIGAADLHTHAEHAASVPIMQMSAVPTITKPPSQANVLSYYMVSDPTYASVLDEKHPSGCTSGDGMCMANSESAASA